MKKYKQVKEKMLKELREMPVTQFACKKVGIGRATFYRWKNEDEVFAKETEKAITEGEELINDMSESQLIALIRDKNFQALKLWLRHHHPKYRNRLEMQTNLQSPNDELTPEQEKIVLEALRLGSLLSKEKPEADNK
jgi:dsRNA-specific ribonuclease